MANEVRDEARRSPAACRPQTTRNCELEARVPQPASDAVTLQSEGLGQSEGAMGAARAPVRDNEVISGQSEWRVESQLMMGILKDSRDFLVPRFCPWIERTEELASRLEASAYVSSFFFVLFTEWPVFGRVSPRRLAAASEKQSSVPDRPPSIPSPKARLLP